MLLGVESEMLGEFQRLGRFIPSVLVNPPSNPAFSSTTQRHGRWAGQSVSAIQNQARPDGSGIKLLKPRLSFEKMLPLFSPAAMLLGVEAGILVYDQPCYQEYKP